MTATYAANSSKITSVRDNHSMTILLQMAAAWPCGLMIPRSGTVVSAEKTLTYVGGGGSWIAVFDAVRTSPYRRSAASVC